LKIYEDLGENNKIIGVGNKLILKLGEKDARISQVQEILAYAYKEKDLIKSKNLF
jgi:hypothetical protein